MPPKILKTHQSFIMGRRGLQSTFDQITFLTSSPKTLQTKVRLRAKLGTLEETRTVSFQFLTTEEKRDF